MSFVEVMDKAAKEAAGREEGKEPYDFSRQWYPVGVLDALRLRAKKREPIGFDLLGQR